MNEQSQIMNQKKPVPLMMSQPPPQMSSQQSQLMNRSYRMWQQPPPINPVMESVLFQNPFNGKPSGPPRSNWQGNKGMDKRKDLTFRRNGQQQVQHNVNNLNNQMLPKMGGGGYQPPALLDLQYQNRTKARKYYHPKRKFNNRFVPYAPRNTSSFIIRAKKSGGIASLVSPCPVTPFVLPTPVFSPSREVLGDIAKEEWGVDGYGSMNGLIRLRSPGNDPDSEEDDDGSSESDVEEHVEVERRLDHDLSRFEMIYPNGPSGDYNNLLQNRVDDQDTHIAHLEEENLTLKERLFLMEREMGDLRRRLQNLERLARLSGDATEEVVENGSDNDAESSGRGEDQQLGIGYNIDLEYIVEHQKEDDHKYQKENTSAVREHQVLQYPNDNAEMDDKGFEEKVECDVIIEESEAMPDQATTEEMQDANRTTVSQEDHGIS